MKSKINTEQHWRECEARQWNKLIEHNGEWWWENEWLPGLIKIRGQENVNYLLKAMNRKDNRG